MKRRLGYLISSLSFILLLMPFTISHAQVEDGQDQIIEVNGIPIHYRTYGEERKGRVRVILINAFLDDQHKLDIVGENFSICCRSAAIDLPGYGLTEKPENYDSSPEAQAQLVVDIAKALSFEKPVYLGHGEASLIALNAGLLDDNAGGLVFISPQILQAGADTLSRITHPVVSLKGTLDTSDDTDDLNKIQEALPNSTIWPIAKAGVYPHVDETLQVTGGISTAFFRWFSVPSTKTF